MKEKVIKMLGDEKQITSEIVSDEKFLKRILLADRSDEVKKVFQEKGINLSNEKVEELRNIFINQLAKLYPIDDESLINISGGKNYPAAICKGVGYGGAYGMWIGSGIGALVGIVDSSLKLKKGEINTSWEFIKGVLKNSILTSVVSCAASSSTGAVTSLISEHLKD